MWRPGADPRLYVQTDIPERAQQPIKKTEGLLWWHQLAVEEILRILDDAPESRWTRRIREVLRRPRPVFGMPLASEEESRRERIYSLQLTDRRSGRMLA